MLSPGIALTSIIGSRLCKRKEEGNAQVSVHLLYGAMLCSIGTVGHYQGHQAERNPNCGRKNDLLLFLQARLHIQSPAWSLDHQATAL